MKGPFHEHDCDECVYIGTFPARRQPFPYDLYLSCDHSFYKFIVRTGPMGDYATTNDPGWYLMAPIVAGEDEQARQDREWREQLDENTAWVVAGLPLLRTLDWLDDAGQ